MVHNQRVEGKVRQQVIGTLGRLDVLQKTGQLDGVIASLSRYAKQVAVLDAHRGGKMPPAESLGIGPALVFKRLWRESGVPKVIQELLAQRKYEFDVERAIFLTVVHRLFDPGSDRAAEVCLPAARGGRDTASKGPRSCGCITSTERWRGWGSR